MQKKSHSLEIEKSEMRPTCTHNIGNCIIARRKEEKDLGVVTGMCRSCMVVSQGETLEETGKSTKKS